MKKNKQLRGERTKKKILDTALILFAKKGYDNVTVDEIVKESETSKGSFYQHFTSKSELFLEKFKEIDDFYLKYSKKIPQKLNADEKILLFIEGQMNYIQYKLGKDIMKVIYSNALHNTSYNYFLDQERHMYKILKKIIKEGWENNTITKQLEMDDILMILTRCMRGSIYDWCMSSDSFNLAYESKMLFVTVLKGLKD